MDKIMAVKASVTSIRISPRKVSVVASLVRGRTVKDALVILENTPRKAAKPLSKVIASAKANAENNHGYKADSLTITSLDIGPGPSYKRFRPVARGSAHPYKRRTTNIHVEVDGQLKPTKAEKAAAKAAKTKTVEKPAVKKTTAKKTADKEKA
jgi:large subunit ribosomal protein L22